MKKAVFAVLLLIAASQAIAQSGRPSKAPHYWHQGAVSWLPPTSFSLASPAEADMSSLQTGKVVREIFTGAAVGVTIGMVGGGVGALAEQKLGKCRGQEFCGVGGALLGFTVGYALGSAIGVHTVGSEGEEAGSFLATLAGGVLGYVGVLAGWPGYFIGPPVGATIGFNLTRRNKSPAGASAFLLYYRRGRWRLGVPAVTVQPGVVDATAVTYHVRLVGLRF